MKSIRKISTKLILGLLVIGFVSCSKDDDTAPEVKADLTVVKKTDVDGSTATVYYSLALNKQVLATEAWDLSFAGTTISTNTNVSAQLVDGVFSTYVTAPTTGYNLKTSFAGSGSWYTYSFNTLPMHIVNPQPGKLIIVKTADAKYAKVEMISYYKGNPTIKSTSSGATDAEFGTDKTKFYTFQFAYQADGTTNLK